MKEKLIEILSRYNTDTAEDVEYVAQKLVDAGVVADSWVSVDDRLPEDDAPEDAKQIKVMTALKGKNGYTVRSQMRMKVYGGTRGYYWDWKFSHGEVTHWKPMPAPPNKT